MPYKNEFSNKSSHIDLAKSADVKNFLERCENLTVPSLEEAEKIIEYFTAPSPSHTATISSSLIAIDGSLYESSIDEFVPSTKVGYVKIGSLLIDLQQFKSLRILNNRFVDPFKVAQLQEQNDSISFALPSSNVILKGQKSVRNSFRAELDRKLYEIRIRENDPNTSLRTTLFHLASRRPIGLKDEELGTGDPQKLYIHKCPNEDCDNKKIEVLDIPDQQYCKRCSDPIYPSDCLRIWEEVSEYQSNITALSRFMQVLEHLLPIHYIRCLFEEGASSIIGSFAFIIDGPLAIFGPAAWLHATILKYIHEVNTELEKQDNQKIFIMSLVKSGQISDYVNLINRFLPNDRLLAVSDEFRYKYISPGREKARNGFGYETYYGQDFIYKTKSGRVFVFNLVYPFSEKNKLNNELFASEKVNYQNYNDLPKALALIEEFECDLYENSVIPIALAHRYTSISLEPGSKVLDLLTKKAFK